MLERDRQRGVFSFCLFLLFCVCVCVFGVGVRVAIAVTGHLRPTWDVLSSSTPILFHPVMLLMPLCVARWRADDSFVCNINQNCPQKHVPCTLPVDFYKLAARVLTCLCGV